MEPLQGWVIAWAVGEVVVPLGVGAGLGRVWAARGTPSTARLLGVGGLLLLAVLGVDAVLAGPSLWDLALVGGLGVGGVALGAGLVPRRSVVGYAAGTAVALLLAEGAVRALTIPWFGMPSLDLPPTAVLGDGHPDLPAGVRTWTEVACRWMHLAPGDVDRELAARRTNVDGGPGVLHVGDSVVAGLGVPLDRSFVADLDRMDPDRWHVQFAVPGTSVDISLQIARAWLDARPWDEVVQYVLLVNDLHELDLALPCCDDGPALTADLAPSCPTPAPVGPIRWSLGRSRPPFPLAVAAHGSALAAQVYKAWWMLSLEGRHLLLADPTQAADQARIDRIAAIEATFVTEVRAHGAAPAVVVLPVHPRMVQLTEGEMDWRHDRLVAALDARGVPYVDAYDWALRLASAGVDLDPLYHGDVHFSVEGNERFAAWLGPRLAALRAADGPEDAPTP